MKPALPALADHFSHPLWQWAWLLLLLAFSAYIRFHGVSDFAYNTDEAQHYAIAKGKDLKEVWDFAHFENHPPLFYMLQHYFLMLWDNPRYFPLLESELLILGYFFIGKKIGGDILGMSCAFLIAISIGCIKQSTARQYSTLLLFLSAAFYCYLLWKEHPRGWALLAYALFGTLAALSHFSAMLFFFCLGLYEAIGMIRQKRSLFSMARWAAANGFILAVGVGMYLTFLPILAVLLDGPFRFAIPDGMYLTNVIYYPFAVTAYILPNLLLGALALVALAIIAYRKPLFYRATPRMQTSFALTGFGLAFGLFLYATRIYPPLVTRHNLWLLPFVIPSAGWLVLLCYEHFIRPLSGRNAVAVWSVTLLACVFLLYDKELRFRDGGEYVVSRERQKQIDAYLSELSASDLIVTEKDDAVTMLNIYPALSHNPADMAGTIPYLHTDILLNSYYPHFFNRDIFLATMEQANMRGMFKGKDRLIFFRLVWSRSPVSDLMLCDILPKRNITIPAQNDKPLTRLGILQASATAMEVDTQTFLREVLAPNGKARACLDGKHDQTTIRASSGDERFWKP